METSNEELQIINSLIEEYDKTHDIPFFDLSEEEQQAHMNVWVLERLNTNIVSNDTKSEEAVKEEEPEVKDEPKEEAKEEVKEEVAKSEPASIKDIKKDKSKLKSILTSKKSKATPKDSSNESESSSVAAILNNSSSKSSDIKYKTLADDLLKKSDYEWRHILSKDINVYKTSSGKYIYREYDKISYSKCINFEGTLVPAIKKNVEMLLRYKYFNDIYTSPNILSDPDLLGDIDKRMLEIKKSFVDFLESTISRVKLMDYNDYNEKMASLDDEESNRFEMLRKLPDYAIAFNDGVYDFKNDCWLFKYNKIDITSPIINDFKGQIVEYEDKTFIIEWHIEMDFMDMIDVYKSILGGLNIKSVCDLKEGGIKDMFDYFRSDNMFDINAFNKKGKRIPNYGITFALLNNMSHDEHLCLSYDKLVHLCQIMGYSLKNSFDSHFIYFIGSGGNGKDSLITGSFLKFLDDDSYTTISISDINNDKFATSNLVDSHINVYMENSTTNAVIKELQTLKALTGGNSVTVEAKGQQKTKVNINARVISAANNKDDLVFQDSSDGLIRRINMCEIFYTWDSDGEYLNKGNKDFYNVIYSPNFKEIYHNPFNLLTYIMFGMAGLAINTRDFTLDDSKFLYNDWSSKYIDLDIELRDKLDNIKIDDIYSVILNPKFKTILNNFACDITPFNRFLCSTQDRNRTKYLNENTYLLSEFGTNTFLSSVIEAYVNPKDQDESEYSRRFFNDFIYMYIPIEIIQAVVEDDSKPVAFTKVIKKYFKGNVIRVERNREKRYVVKVRIFDDSIDFIQ